MKAAVLRLRCRRPIRLRIFRKRRRSTSPLRRRHRRHPRVIRRRHRCDRQVVNRNIVRGVQPPGQIWVIAEPARPKSDATARYQRRRPRAAARRRQQHRRERRSERPRDADLRQRRRASALRTAGSCRSRRTATSASTTCSQPAVPAECASPVLLIRNPAGAWFAAGIVRGSKRYGTSAKERSAEPVPPRILSGGTTSRNSYSFAAAISSRK